jgi:ATP synthase protein I
MTDPQDAARLKALEQRLSQMKKGKQLTPHMEQHHAQAHLAWRMVIELVAGMVIGFGIGFGLDFLLGTKPFLMVLFILLGFVAGVKTMIRSAKEIQEKTIAAVAAREDERD